MKTTGDNVFNLAAETMRSLIDETARGYLGKPEVVSLLVQAMTSGLHVLMEDVSGVGKTTLIRCLAKACGLDYGRIQFTPDLLPGDITGMTIWDPVKRDFIFKDGPVRHQFLLADELNRAPARTQSALLEAMQEGAVTVDGKRNILPDPFFVAATQNPSWYAGTYNLPESQLDRFGISVSPGYPDSSTEASILLRFKEHDPDEEVSSITVPERIKELKELICGIHIDEKILNYTTAIGKQTRESSGFHSGLSTRGLQHLIRLAQSRAVMNGRGFVIPEDLIESAIPVMRHRLVLTPEARTAGKTIEYHIRMLLSDIAIPAGYNTK